jgi:hypothetical protein
VKALGVELEVVAERIHRALHRPARRRRELAVEGRDRPLAGGLAQLGDALIHDAHRLAHLLHADHLPVVGVAVLGRGDVELHLLVAPEGLRLAQVPREPEPRTITPEKPQSIACRRSRPSTASR